MRKGFNPVYWRLCVVVVLKVLAVSLAITYNWLLYSLLATAALPKLLVGRWVWKGCSVHGRYVEMVRIGLGREMWPLSVSSFA